MQGYDFNRDIWVSYKIEELDKTLTNSHNIINVIGLDRFGINVYKVHILNKNDKDVLVF
jgi:hypothetical protein